MGLDNVRAGRPVDIAALFELRPRPNHALAVSHQPELREEVDDHLARVELCAHAELGCGVVEGVFVVPGTTTGAEKDRGGERERDVNERVENSRVAGWTPVPR